MVKHYEQTEQKIVKGTGKATHEVGDVLDLNEIWATLEGSTAAQRLREIFESLETKVFTASGTPRVAVIKSEIVRDALIKVYFAAQKSLEELKSEFSGTFVGTTTPAALKITGDAKLFDAAVGELYKLLDKYIKKAEPYFTPGEKKRLGLIESFAEEQEGGRELAKKDIKGLLQAWFVKDIAGNDTIRYTAEALWHEKLLDLKSRFIEQAKKIGETAAQGEKRWEDYRKLVELTWALTDFGIMRADSINPVQGTAKHDVLFPPPEKGILAPTNKPNAMDKANAEFNLNPIVYSKNVDPSEQYSFHMGVIQMLCFAAYQEMKSKSSPYTRNAGFEADKMDNLLKEVSGRTYVRMWDGSQRNGFNVKAELEKFPDETRELLLTVAKWKIARDDLGSQAGIWHLGRNKGAFKYSDGANGRPSGLLAAICYQVGKNSKFENHLATTAFMTPQETELMPPPDPATGKRSHDNDVDIDQAIEQVDRFEIFKDPQIVNIMYDIDPATRKPIARHKYRPEHWWQDFPMLSQFFNQTEKVLTGADYIKSRDAVLKIIETAARSPLITIDIDPIQMEEKIKKILQDFNTEIGKAIAYIAPWNDGTRLHNKGADRPDKVNPMNYVNELILAAYKFLISNILEAIPSANDVPLLDPLRLTMMDYDNRYRRAVFIIEDVINRNSTLKPYFQVHLTGQMPAPEDLPDLPAGLTLTSPVAMPFVTQNFRRRWRDVPRLGNEYKSWTIRNVNRYKNFNTREKMQFMSSAARSPINQGQGWTSSYEDPRYEKTA